MVHMFKVILYFTISAALVQSERILRFNPTDISVWSDNEYLNFTYTLVKSDPSADVEFHVLKTIPDVDVNFEGSVSFENSENHGGSARASFSLCRLFEMRNANAIAMFIYAKIRSHGKVPEHCPVKKGAYSLHSIWVPENLFPSTFPEHTFQVVMHAYVIDNGQRAMIFNATVIGEAKQKNVPRSSLRKSSLFGLTDVNAYKS